LHLHPDAEPDGRNVGDNMKRSRDIVDSRRKKIIAILQKTGDIRVMDIASHLKVSEITVRRDLQYLEDMKVIDRYYGGARVRQETQKERRSEIALKRDQIARLAASLVEDKDTIFINTSSTALEMIKYIDAKDVTVITNNANAILEQKSHSVKVILTGGELYNIKGTLVGEFAKNNLLRVNAKKAFLGCAGLSLENGMTTEILNEVDLNQAMLQHVTGRAFIMCDHTKLGKSSSFISCGMDMIREVITDDRADKEYVKALRERGVHVSLAGEEVTQGGDER
jgi:DeoR/GlpR family transcriptional regulator of sugar metabolism